MSCQQCFNHVMMLILSEHNSCYPGEKLSCGIPPLNSTHFVKALLHFVGSLPTFSLPTFLLNLEDSFRRISVSTELFFTPFQDLFLKTCIELILLKALPLWENKFANVSFRKGFWH